MPCTALISCVALAQCNSARDRYSIMDACCSIDLIETKRMFGRTTASQMPSASAAAFLLDLTNGRTYCGGIRRTSWPRRCSSRPVMAARAGLNTDQGPRKASKEHHDLGAAKAPAEHAPSVGISAVYLEYILGDIEANHGRTGRHLLIRVAGTIVDDRTSIAYWVRGGPCHHIRHSAKDGVRRPAWPPGFTSAARAVRLWILPGMPYSAQSLDAPGAAGGLTTNSL
jgi:hypothetical protein